MKAWVKLFLSGWLANSASRSLTQDAIGQEKYLKLIETAWVSAWYTVPLALVWFLVALMMLREGRREIVNLPFCEEDTPARAALVKIVGWLSEEHLAPLGKKIKDTALDGLR